MTVAVTVTVRQTGMGSHRPDCRPPRREKRTEPGRAYDLFTASLVRHHPASRILQNTLLAKESTYSNIRHMIVSTLPQSVHRSIVSLFQLPSSSNPSGHRQPTLGVIFMLYRNKLPVFVVSVYLLS